MRNYAVMVMLTLLWGCSLYAADVELYRVVPSKIIYRTNEEGSVEVVLANKSAEKRSVEIRLQTRWEMDDRREIGRCEVGLDPGEERSVTFNWNTGAERYGREVRAELYQNGQLAGIKSEFFNVINEWWRVQTGNGSGILLGPAIKENGSYPLHRKVFDYYHYPFQVPEYRSSGNLLAGVGPFVEKGYGNTRMLFASTPALFGSLVPPDDFPDNVAWTPGSGQPAIKTADWLADLERAKKWGFKTTMFSINSLAGPTGFEIGRQHPEWIARTETGAFAFANWASSSASPELMDKPITQHLNAWYGLLPDLYSTDAVKFASKGLKDTIRRFGWDGIFFDNCGYVVSPSYSYHGVSMPNGQDQEEISARNLQTVNEDIWSEFPEAFIWYNGANPDSKGSFYPAGNGGGKKGKLQMVADQRNGSLYEVQSAFIMDPKCWLHSWRTLYEAYMAYRNSLRLKQWERPVRGDTLLSGYVFSGSRYEMTQDEYRKTREDWAWANHLASLNAAAQFHFLCGGNAFRPMMQLQTRYSGFFWDENIRIVDKSFKQYELDSLREIWWEEGVYERKTKQGSDIIFNLINAPEGEVPDYRIFSDPHPADDVEITCLNINSAAGVRVWAIQPYDYDSQELIPVQTELKPEIVDGRLVIAVPKFHYYSLVVIRLPKDAPK